MRRRHVTSLDGLRALCALGIVGYHMNLNWCQGGLIGVTVFFVLSGYLVTSSLVSEFSCNHGRIDIKRFWAKRIKRIMPTAIVYVVVVAAVMTFASHLLLTKMRPDIAPSLLMVLNWFKIFTNESYFAAAGAPSPLTHFWYLAIDAQFYLVWVFVLYLLLRKRVKSRPIKIGLLVAAALSAILMAVLYVPGEDPSRTYYGTDTRAMSLLLGCWLAFAWPFSRKSAQPPGSKGSPSRAFMEAFGFGGVALLIAMMIFTEGYSPFSYYGGILLCSVISVVAIAGLAVPGTTVSKVLSVKPLSWLGERSFAIYIWHYPIIELLQPRNATMLPWWIYLVELALTLVIAELSYRFIEKPFKEQGLTAVKDVPPEASVKAMGSAGPQGTDAKPTFIGWIRTHIPATAIICAITAVAAVGIITVPAVTVGGVAADEKRVMSATLKKPLVDGVYDIVFIGDSVSLGVNGELNEAFPHGLIDTEGNRQFYEGIEAFRSYIDQGIVGDTVIFSLGTNGYVEEAELQQIMDMVGPSRTVWFVNTRVPEYRCETNNDILQEFADAHENTRIIDWYGESAGHDDWLAEDGIHLTFPGQEAYTALVTGSIGYVAPTEENTKYDVTFIGDTVALDAADQLGALFPLGLVDCAEGRDQKNIESVYESYATKDVVGPTVILCIGNEEKLDSAVLESLLNRVGADKTVWLVNNRCTAPWCSTNNELLESISAARGNISVIDWHSASQGHDAYLAENGVNLTEQGAAAFAQSIQQALAR